MLASSTDLRLTDAAAEVDKGTPLANLDDAYGISGVPDIGAYEKGAAQRSYGPRTAATTPPPDSGDGDTDTGGDTDSGTDNGTPTSTTKKSGCAATDPTLAAAAIAALLLQRRVYRRLVLGAIFLGRLVLL